MERHELPKRRHTDHFDLSIDAETLRFVGAPLLGAISLITWILAGVLGPTRPFLAFALAVVPLSVATGRALGWRLGLVATSASALAGLYLILPPRFSIAFLDDGESAFFAAVLIGTAFAAFVLGRKPRQPKTDGHY